MIGTMEIRAPGMAGQTGTYDQQAIWQQVPWNDIGRGIDGTKWELNPHDFPSYAAVSNPTIAAGSAITPLYPGAVYYDTGNVIAKAVDEPFGAVAFTGSDADNDEQWFQPGGNAGGMVVFNDPAVDTAYNVAYDCAFKLASVAANVRAQFLGFGEEGMATANTMVDDTGAMANKDWIGFRTLHGASAENATLQFAFKKADQTLVTVAASFATLAAATLYRVGFLMRYGVHPNSRVITLYKENLPQLVGVTLAQIQAVGFPDGEEMAPLIGGKNGAATDNVTKVYRAKCAMWKSP